jgi:hypothetical protein
MKKSPRLSSLIVAFLLPLLPASTLARVSVPESRQIPIFLKILAYDRNLNQRVGERLNIGIIYSDRTNPESGDNLSNVIEALGQNQSTEIKGLPVTFTVLRFSTPEAFTQRLMEAGINIVYLTSGLRENLRDIVAVTRQLKVLSLAAEIVYLKSGVALGLHPIEGRLRIFINLKASREEGARFSANILKLCEIVGD